jgi:excinuclease UvrABC nuclease subunit
VLTERIEFHPQADAEFFANIAPEPAVFVLRGADPASEPYVSKTANLRRRLQRLLSPPEERTRRLNLRNRVRSIEYSFTGSDFESAFVLYSALRSIFPDTYGNRLRLRFAPLVKLHLENEFPRASITTRLGKIFEEEQNPATNIYYGPFASRLTAEKFMNDALDFFKMRRCIDDLHPDPKFPGCVYSEMKMCLAPCYRGCTEAEYKSEVARVKEFFDTRGESLKRTIAGEREAASANMEFESAAAIHGRLNKLSALLQHLPDYVCRVDEMHAVIVQKAVQRMKQREVQKAAATQGKMFGDESPADAHTASVALFRVDAGAIAGPLHFSISSPEHTKSQSMEARIAEALSSFSSAKPRTTTERMEHLAILKRWCYRGNRAGEIFFADARGELPMRRLVRGISRVFKGEGRDDEMVPSPAD